MDDQEAAGEPPLYLGRSPSTQRQASQDELMRSKSTLSDSDDVAESPGNLALPRSYSSSSPVPTSECLQNIVMTTSEFRSSSNTMQTVDVTQPLTSGQPSGLSESGGGGSMQLMNLKQRLGLNITTPPPTTVIGSGSQHFPQTSVSLSSSASSSPASPSMSLLRETLQLPHSSLPISLSYNSSTISDTPRGTLTLPQTAAVTQLPALAARDSLQLPLMMSCSPVMVTVPPAPTLKRSLQLPRTGMTPPPSVVGSTTIRENLTLPHTAASPLMAAVRESLTLPQTAVISASVQPPTASMRDSLTLPRTLRTPPMAPTAARELQLPLTSSTQLPQTADVRMPSLQAMSPMGTSWRLQLPKSDILSLAAVSTPRDTLHLPRASAPQSNDGSRLKLQLPSTASEVVASSASPAHQGSDVIRSLLQLPPSCSYHIGQSTNVTVNILGQSHLQSTSLIKKEMAASSQSNSALVARFDGDRGLHSHSSVLEAAAAAAGVDVNVHVPEHVTSVVYHPADVAGLQVSNSAVAGMAITKTEDGGRVIVAYAEDGRPLSTSRVEEVPVSYISDDQHLRLPHGTGGQMEIVYEDESGRNSVSYRHDAETVSYAEDNRDVQYIEDLRVQVAFMEDGTRVNLVYEQQGDGYVAVAYTEDGRRITVPYTIETVPQAELNRVAAGLLRKNYTSTGVQEQAGLNRLGSPMDDVGRLGMQLQDAGLQQLQPGSGRGVSVSQLNNATRYDTYAESDLHMPQDHADVPVHTGSQGVSGCLDMKTDNSSLNLSQGGHEAALGLDASQHGDTAVVTLPQTVVLDVRAMSHADYLPVGAGAQYQDSSTLLPHTSNVQAINLSQPTVSALHSPGVPSSSAARQHGVLQSHQPPADDINMRMMAAAAEIMSQSSQPVDDVNMRLMAETADYISRSTQQTSSMAAVSTPATDISARFLAQQGGKAVLANRGIDPSNGQPSVTSGASLPGAMYPSGRGEINMAPSTLDQLPLAISVTQQMLKKEETESDTVRGFREEFFKSQSYSRWRQIGKSTTLQSDEEIACFLMKYYEDTIGLFPDNSPTCLVCKHAINVACLYCMKRAAGEDTDAEDTDADNDLGALDDQRNKLWKIIVAASSNKDGGEAAGKSSQRPQVRTQQLPQTSTDPSALVVEDKDTSSDDPGVHFESQEEKKPFVSGMRKRGRPSNESYKSGDLFSCWGCGKKFHTLIGLDKHKKLKRCKPSEVSEDENEEPPNKSINLTDFNYECVACKKKYRSKQGLMLHQASKHSEVQDKSHSTTSDGEETDEYSSSTPRSPAKTPDTTVSVARDDSGLYPCDGCSKKYRSKQGLVLHKISKHSEIRIKTEVAEPGSARPDVGMITRSRGASGSTGVSAGSGLSPPGSIPAEVTVAGGSPIPATPLPQTAGMVGAAQGSAAASGHVYQCTQCERQYITRPGLMLHMKSKHSPQVLLSCQTCREKFKTKLELRIHIRKEHSAGSLVLFCPYCPVTFSDRQILKQHMSDNHKTCRQTLYDCFGCDLQFSSRIERKRHIQSEHKGKDTSLTCHFCGQWFATRMEYSIHEEEGHSDTKQEWLCATCGDALPTKYLLQRHALTHKEKIDCELCGKSITEPCYDDHMKRHFGTKSWQCELCPKSFIRKAELQQHMLVHKDERPFCCELCGVRYREKSRLNSHMRTHAGIKPYKCEQCEKRFTRSRELKNHQRVHTGEKPFSCSVCGRKFASSGNLSAHRRKVHKLSPIPHGMQSRRHMLEEKTKTEVQVEPQHQELDPHHHHQQQLLPVALTESAMVQREHQDCLDSDQAAAYSHSSGLPSEVHLSHHTDGLLLRVHKASVTHHQPPVSHGDALPAAGQAVALVYQQGQVLAKYEPVVGQPELYVAQVTAPQGEGQQEGQAVPLYWASNSYIETQ